MSDAIKTMLDNFNLDGLIFRYLQILQIFLNFC